MRQKIITQQDAFSKIQELRNTITGIQTERGKPDTITIFDFKENLILATFLAEVNPTKENIRGWTSDLEQQSSN